MTRLENMNNMKQIATTHSWGLVRVFTVRPI